MRILKGTILLVFVCVFIRIAVGKPCVVPSGSMEPTLLCGDRLWINKLAYGGRLPKRWADIPLLNVFTWIRPLRIADEQNHWKYFRLPGFTQPQLGDIVVFNSPMDERAWLVKRITHIIPQGDTLAINKETLNSYRSLIIREGSSIAKYRNRIFINGKCDSLYITKHTFYFMEGDNRDNSHDSRYFGYISEDAIVGKFDRVLYSFDSDKCGWKSIRWKRIFEKL